MHSQTRAVLNVMVTVQVVSAEILKRLPHGLCLGLSHLRACTQGLPPVSRKAVCRALREHAENVAPTARAADPRFLL